MELRQIVTNAYNAEGIGEEFGPPLEEAPALALIQWLSDKFPTAETDWVPVYSEFPTTAIEAVERCQQIADTVRNTYSNAADIEPGQLVKLAHSGAAVGAAEVLVRITEMLVGMENAKMD